MYHIRSSEALTAALALARNPEVRWVEPAPRYKTLNSDAQ
jgi:hypothetical protein